MVVAAEGGGGLAGWDGAGRGGGGLDGDLQNLVFPSLLNEVRHPNHLANTNPKPANPYTSYYTLTPSHK